MSRFEDPVIITNSISGAVANRDQCPAIPYTPEEYAAEARRVVDECSNLLTTHCHGRDRAVGPVRQLDWLTGRADVPAVVESERDVEGRVAERSRQALAQRAGGLGAQLDDELGCLAAPETGCRDSRADPER